MLNTDSLSGRLCAKLVALTALLAVCFIAPFAQAEETPAKPKKGMSVSEEEDGVSVYIDGELFTRYVKNSGIRPILWPVFGPTGEEITRGYPMVPKKESEHADHIHHRSIWIGYEGLNGYDFWHEPATGGDRMFPIGSVKHCEFLQVGSTEEVATIETRNDWLDPEGKAVCHDERLIKFGADGDQRWIDYRVTLWSSDQDLVLGDTKEGFFAVRVAGTMKVDAGLGGQFVNDQQQVDGKAWGMPAKWVDYTGPVKGETVGIAIFTDPSNNKPTPRWHVREYGLYTANPFGVVPYTGDPNGEKGGLTVPKGERIQMNYRVVLHRGTTEEADIAGAYEKFAK